MGRKVKWKCLSFRQLELAPVVYYLPRIVVFSPPSPANIKCASSETRWRQWAIRSASHLSTGEES